ncbi:MAG: IS1634 family transposase [Planctomycetota bacterium]
MARWRGTEQPGDRLKSYSHGGVAVLLSLADRLGIGDLIDQHCQAPRPSRPTRRLRSVGQTLLLGAIGRALHPTSKRGWAAWARTTTLGRLWHFDVAKITSEFFWDQMDRLPVDAVPAIQTELARRVRTTFGLQTDSLFYDATNFFTFIDSTNRHCDLPQRGKNKQKRNDLRQFQMGLLVSQDGWIPLLSILFRGNHNDVTTFPQALPEIVRQCKQLDIPVKQVTLVCDKGNLSKANWQVLDESSLGYVASVVPSHYPEWSQRDLGGFQTLQIPDAGELRCLRDQAEIAGKQRTLVVLDSPMLRAGQLRGLSQQLHPVMMRMTRLQQSLAQAKRRRRKELIEKQITRFVKPAAVRRIVQYELRPRPGKEGYWDLDWWIDREAYQHLRDRVFGRRILVTNRDGWPTESVVCAYWGQSQAEHVFRNLKDPYHLALRPQFHWTDQKIQVHAFCCLVGYLLAALVRRTARQMGYAQGISQLLEMLNEIRIVLRTERRSGPGRPRIRWQLEENDPDATRLYETLVSPDHTLGTTPSDASTS